jgi:hypothetical protein
MDTASTPKKSQARQRQQTPSSVNEDKHLNGKLGGEEAGDEGKDGEDGEEPIIPLPTFKELPEDEASRLLLGKIKFSTKRRSERISEILSGEFSSGDEEEGTGYGESAENFSPSKSQNDSQVPFSHRCHSILPPIVPTTIQS